MKCTVSPQQLGAGLGAVTRAVSNRVTLPILSNVLVEAGQGSLQLTATNLDLTIQHTLAAEVEEEGRVTVPARILSEFVISLPEQPLRWELDRSHQTVTLRCGRFDAHIRGVDAAEFPPLPDVSQGQRLELEPQHLLSAIDQTVIAASSDEGRPVYTGVLTEIVGSSVTMAATDGHRLAVRNLQSSEGADGGTDKVSLIVPARALAELSRLLKPAQTTPAPVTVTVGQSRAQVRFQLPGYELTTRLIDGVYPNYEKVIPSSSQTTVRTSTDELRRTAKVVSLFARDAANVIKLLCEPGQLTLSANTNEVGDNVAAVQAQVEGENVGIAFNARYLTDVLNLLDGPDVELLLNGPVSPGLVRSAGDDSYRYVIMPVRVAI